MRIAAPTLAITTALCSAQPVDAVGPRIVAIDPPPGAWVVGATGLSTVQIEFSEDVTVPSDAVAVWSLRTQNAVANEPQYDALRRELRINFPTAMHDDILTLRIDYSVQNVTGLALDGETTDPSRATLPTGDGVPGGQAVFRIPVLTGDADRSGRVDAVDVGVVRDALGRCVGQPGFDALVDLDLDGCVTAADAVAVMSGWGRTLPVANGVAPVWVEIVAPLQPAHEPFDSVILRFSEVLDVESVDRRTLHLTDESGGLIVPDAVAASPFGSEIIYYFSDPLPPCDTYLVRVSPWLRATSGAPLDSQILQRLLTGRVPPTMPRLEFQTLSTDQVTFVLSGSVLGAGGVEVISVLDAVTIPVVDGTFTSIVTLSENQANPIHVTGLGDCVGDRGPTALLTVTQDREPPTLIIDQPLDGATAYDSTIAMVGRIGDRLSGSEVLTVRATVNENTGDVRSGSVQSGVGAYGTFLISGLELSTGDNVIEVTGGDLLGNQCVKVIRVFRAALPVADRRLSKISGEGQTARIREPLSEPLVVKVTSTDGVSPLPDRWVDFEVIQSDGRLAASPGELSSITDQTLPGVRRFQALTDAQGRASAYWRMGTDAGEGCNRVRVTTTDGDREIEFLATATPGPFTRLHIGGGSNQRVEALAETLAPLTAKASDGCNGVPGVSILFEVVEGGGLVNGATQSTVRTGAMGHAQVRFTAGADAGPARVRASVPGSGVIPAEFVLEVVKRDPLVATSFRGLVLDNGGQPLGGATCTLFVNGDAVSVIPSAADGTFTFENLLVSGPAGLTVDGATVTLAGGIALPTGMFPSLHFETLIIPQSVNELPTPVLLPRLNPVNARAYSTVRDTVLTISGIEGLKLTVRAGSMFVHGAAAADGELLMLNAVHHDDIPMPLPDGASPPFAGTLYPPWATFDPPIAVEYPNMSGLPPGSVTYFLSFDHDTSRFDVVATGRVSEDGSIIRSDPGMGIPHGGWHCNCPPYSVTGTVCSGCDGNCCDGDCCNGVCCPGGCCGGVCCENCCGGQCCDGPCCGGECCGSSGCCSSGGECCAGECCADGACCEDGGECCRGESCCSEGSHCCPGSAVGWCCPDNQECCGQSGCCPTGGSCCEQQTGLCCSPGEACCGLFSGDKRCCAADQECCADGSCCDQTCDECLERGELSEGVILMTPSVLCPGTPLQFKLEGVQDGGGRRRVNCREEVVPPLEPTITWTLRHDAGATVNGSGRIAKIASALAGVYTITYHARADRPCPPDPRTIGPKSVAVSRADLVFDGVNEFDEKSPGAFLALNRDDDDENGSPDHDDSGPTLGEDDALPLTLSIGDLDPAGTGTLSGAAGASRIRIFADAQRGQQVSLPVTFAGVDLPKTLFVEGTAVSASQGDVRLDWRYSIGEEAACEDSVRVTVVTFDAATDINLDGSIDPIVDGAQEDVAPGRVVIVNDDDDDGDGIEDRIGPAGFEDDEPAEVRLQVTPTITTVPTPANWRVENSSSARTYRDRARQEPIGSGQANPWPLPGAVFWEALESSAAPGDTPLEASIALGNLDGLGDSLLGTSVYLHVDAPGDLDTDESEAQLAAVMWPLVEPDLGFILDGAQAKFKLVRNAAEVSQGLREMYRGAAGVTLPMFSGVGDELHATLRLIGTVRSSESFRIVPGMPRTLDLQWTTPGGVADGAGTVELYATFRDGHGNLVEDGTPVSAWVLESDAAPVDAEPTDQVTIAGAYSAAFVAPTIPGALPVTVGSSPIESVVSQSVTSVSGSLTGPTVLDLAAEPLVLYSLQTDAVDGATVHWTFSNGPTSETQSTVTNGGSSVVFTVGPSDGTSWRVGPLIVTATIAEALFVHQTNLDSSRIPFVEWNRWVISGDAETDGEESFTLPATATIPDAPPVVPSRKITLPYFAAARAVIHGPPLADFEVTLPDPADADWVRLEGVDAAGRVALDGSGRATVTVRSNGAFDGLPSTWDFTRVEVLFRDVSPCNPCLRGKDEALVETVVLVEHSWWTRTVDAVRSFFGGDPKTATGIAANVAGGMLVVGDVGSLLKNAWRTLGFSDRPPSASEAALSSLGLLTELAVGVGESADAPISGVRAIVAAVGETPFSKALVILLKRGITNAGDMLKLASFVARLVSDGNLLQVVKGVFTSAQLLESGVRLHGELGDAFLDLIRRVSTDAALGGIAVAQKVTRTLHLLPADVLALLRASPRLPEALDGLAKAIHRGGVDPETLHRILTQDFYTTTYQQAEILVDLGVVAHTNGFEKIVNRLTTNKHTIDGFVYELQVGAHFARQGADEIIWFEKAVRADPTHIPPLTKTDVDVAVGGTSYQCKNGRSAFQVMGAGPKGAKKALAWITKVRNAGAKNIKFATPPGTVIPPMIQAVLDREGVEVVYIARP